MKRNLISVCLLFLFLFVASSAALAAGDELKYHGNTSSQIFHRAGCRYYNCSKCTATFASRDAAIKAGYRPCKVCRP